MATKSDGVRWKSLSAILTFLLSASCTGSNIYENQARFHNEQGHLYIIGAKDRNITFKTSGNGFININGQDLLSITKIAKSSSELLDRYPSSFQQGQISVSEFALSARLRHLEATLSHTNTSNVESYRAVTRRLRILQNRVTSLTRVVRGLRQLLSADECESSPCQNGGSCTDMFNGFHCHCTSGWQGSMCELDVNECQDFAGTDLGCKNGATCRNYKGSYACTCAPGWYGLRCTERTYDCTTQSSAELCGHGICVNQGGTGRGFVCICNEGWTANEGDGTCTVDKNECAGPHRPCSQDPFVECLNSVGSFSCGNCPRGYIGNGFHCTDIDECEINNGGCSVSPAVECINTRGSRRCGPCPPGYIGDGMSCTRSGKCLVNNGGCHPLAICKDNSALQYVECRCPAGFTGSGVGTDGCTQPTSPFAAAICDSSPCNNGGTCIPIGGDRFMCRCKPGFAGANCSELLDACSSAPCKNGGTCIRLMLSLRVDYYRCKCPDGFSGRNCETKQDACVSTFSDPSGNMSWPTTNETISLGRYYTCAWTITTTYKKVVNLTFTEASMLSVKSGSQCILSYIEVYDGVSSSSVQLSHFCGPQLPPPIISSRNSLYITAKLANFRSSLKFNWTTIDPHCGGELNATVHGTFSSPGSPGRYPRNAHCIWKLYTVPGQRIHLTFFSMDIEDHKDCHYDYLEIRAGDSESSPLLRKLCNSTLPPPLTSSSHELTVIFHSDSSRDGKGFQIAYSPQEGIPGCGGVHTTSRGEFSPPHIPGGTEYLEALNCQWLIELPHTERIQVSFSSFSIESSEGCTYDSLEVYDGPSKDSGLIGRWCGEEKIAPFTSSSNSLLVVFTTDYSMNEGNFVLSYTAVCGGRWTDSAGSFSSPYYPNPYPEDRTCTYLIERPIGNAVKLLFSDFDLEDSDDCSYDKLEIYDGDSADSRKIGEYCGLKKPGEIISTYNFLYLVLTTDISEQKRGFLANYSSIDISCGGILTAPSGTINSPQYPDRYPPNQDCTWVISTKPGTVIRLTWLAFHVDKSYKCIRDYVQMYDNNTVHSLGGPLGGRYCGNKLPPVVTTSSNHMSIVFHADSGNSEPGFSASYVTVNAKDVCGGNYFATAGILNSPNYPNGYPNNLDCQWVINVPDGQQIELSPTAFSIENYTNCLIDYLEVRNGGHASSPLINKYCGSSFTSPIISTTNQLFLRLVTDIEDSGPGFSLIWDGAKTGCGGTLTSSSGSIMSPNYPQSYGRDGECTWKISVAHGSTIRLTLADFDLEDHSSCSLDYLEIFDGGKRQSPKIARICSENNHPGFYDSKGNTMLLRFRSDSSRQGRGFHLKYQAVCNLTLKGYRGIIESPGFPRSEFVERDCLWKIEAPIGNKINMTFSHFDLQDATISSLNETCKRHSVNIYDGALGANNLVGNYCSSNIPRRLISSSTNEVYVKYSFHQDVTWIEQSLFRLEWAVYGCGGVFKSQRHGVITSPNYPQPYPHSTHCEWYLSVLPGNSIVIKIDDLQIEDSKDCEFDALEVYGGLDDTSPLLAKLCSKINSQSTSVLTTSGNNAFIRFRTDASSTGIGFHSTFNMSSSACGGLFTSPYGSIHSHNYPQNYDEHDDCSFTITVDKVHTVNLTFTDFDVDALDSNCSNAFVKVYDGDSAEAPLMQTFCGNKLPPSIFSTQNSLFIRHKTDGFSVAKGFFAKYQTACGAIITTDNVGTINFAEANSTLRWNSELKCEWIIKSKLPDSKIRLQFALMELNTLDYEEIFNGTQLRHGLNILLGEGLDAPLFKNYEKNSIPPPILVPSSVVTVVFKGHENRDPVGRFILDYSVLDTACGGSPISAESGTIVSPNFPDPYPNNAECVWTLLLAPGNKMDLQFKKFSLQDSESCNEDYVEIRSKSDSGSLMGLYCGSSIPERITTNSSLWIKFRSGVKGSETLYSGFEANFALETKNEMTGFVGEIASPLYPLSYHQPQTYSWRISVKTRHVIRFAFTDFNIDSVNSEEFAHDCYNKLVVYGGFDESAPVLQTLCGPDLPEPFTSESNIVFVELKQTFRGLASRFFMNWMQMEKNPPSTTTVTAGSNCTTYVELKRGVNSTYTFKSPGYPTGYENRVHCEWIFQSAPGDHIQIFFQSFTLEISSGCRADSVTIYNGGIKGRAEEWVESEKLCRENATTKHYYGTQLVKLVFKTDSSVTRLGFLASAKAECGGEFNQPNGVISEGPYNNCQWNVTVKPGRTIKLTLEKFLLRGPQPCSSNYLILKDGGSKDSPDLLPGKHCGERVFDIPDTKSNHLYILYQSGSTEGFTLRFEEKPLSCGETIMLDSSFGSTVISSPNYPNVPPSHIECIWQVIVPSGESVHFEVHDRFDMTYSKDCSIEYLELREGSSEFGQLIGRYCSETPSYITTEGNSLYVKYYTDSDVPKDGFRASVSIAKCGGTIYTNKQNGTITSPGYPESYEENLNCTWKLVTDSSSIISLNVSINLGGLRNPCNTTIQDTLKLKENLKDDSITLEGPEEVVLCGLITSYRLSSESNELLINFLSLKQPIHRGKRYFRVDYSEKRKKCGGSLNLPSGIIKSPNYPTSYDKRIFCTWRITVPQGRRITFSIIDLDLMEGTNRTKPHYLSFYQGFNYHRIKLISGTLKNVTFIESSGNKMMIQYRSLYKTTHRGFIGNYTSDQPALCGGLISTQDNHGTLDVADRLLRKDSAFDCRWDVITSPSTDQTTITFSFEGTAYPPNYHTIECRWIGSRLTIIDKNAVLVGDFCSSTKPNSPYSVSKPHDKSSITYANVQQLLTQLVHKNFSPLKNSIIEDAGAAMFFKPPCTIYPIITMRRDTPFRCLIDLKKFLTFQAVKSSWSHISEVKEGSKVPFSLKWKIDPCGGTLKVSQPVTVKSPRLNSFTNSYPSNTDCVWSVSTTEGSTLKIHFTKFDLGADCQDDYLKIHNGNSPLAPVMSLRCGSIIPADLISQSTHIWIHFHSGSPKQQKNGFSLDISQADSACGGIFHLKQGEIKSPGYPSNYQNNIECDWELQAPLGFHIGLTLIGRFFLEHSSGCERDYLQIFEYNAENWVSITKICGRDPEINTFNTTTNRMRVLFKTNQNITGDGFKANFTWNCGGKIDASVKGHLYSPGWPQPYPINLDCNYTLVAPGKTISLKTEAFELEGAAPLTCVYDFVQFWTKSRFGDFRSNGIYCGKTAPPSLTSVGELKIRFKTDNYIGLRGFDFVYSPFFCGGDITNETAITSDNIESREDDLFRRCTWNITAPEDRIVIIKISELGFSRGLDCRIEYLEIYDNTNSSSNSTSLGKLCGSVSVGVPAYFRSSGNKMRIFLMRYQISKRQPLSILVSFGYGSKVGCGGDIMLDKSEKSILNPDIDRDGLYEDNMDCAWTVSTTSGNTVLLTFNKFDLKPCKGNLSSTCCDALEVYDGASTNTYLIGRYCGQTLPRSISSSRNYMTIRFVTDDEEKASGFRVSAVAHQSPCGPPILNATSTPQLLESPNYPNNYPVNIHCEWRIVTSQRSSIHIHLEEVDLENSTNCSHDRVEVMDEGFISWRLPHGPLGRMIHSYDFSARSHFRPQFLSWRRIPFRPYGNTFSPHSFNSQNYDIPQVTSSLPSLFGHKFCGKRKPIDIYSSFIMLRHMSVKFISDAQNTAKGFKLYYSTAGCSRNYTEPQGRIQISRAKERCTMTISGPENTTISIYFIGISLYKPRGVCNAKLEVFEGSNKTAEICGYGVPPPFFSTSNFLTLKLNTGSGMLPSSADFSYTTTDQGKGCGGEFFNIQGAFTSPLYPGNFRNYSYCCWDITVPVPNSPKVVFKEFDVGGKSTCQTDFVELFDINAETGDKIRRVTYCGGDKPADFVGAGQSVSVCYKTSIHNSGIGWSAAFISTSDGITRQDINST